MRATLSFLVLLVLAAQTARAAETSAPFDSVDSALRTTHLESRVAASQLLDDGSTKAAPSYHFDAEQADRILAQEGEATPHWDEGQSSGAPRRWWSLALSAAVPGLGEAVTGHRRGYFFMAADAASIFGAIHYNKKGDDKEKEYIAFADAHWSESRWEEALRTVDTSPWFGTDYRDKSKDDVPLYVSKEEDAREYYENLGKWDIFWYGWQDSKPSSIGDTDITWDWTNPPPDFITPLRNQYLDMRTASNDAYGNRDKFLTASLLLRLFSVLQVAYLEGFIGGRYNNDYEGPGVGGSLAHLQKSHGAQVNWFVDARSLDHTRLGLQVRY
ncbi:MAG TPA: hypothetical protein VKA63_07960 [Candidatus Krumholzibacteria bacterium]|nr:hypothetical protein [Candidatus Krumholzibacteria bacterium]